MKNLYPISVAGHGRGLLCAAALVATAAAGFPFSADAAIYRYVDADGKVHFTDQASRRGQTPYQPATRAADPAPAESAVQPAPTPVNGADEFSQPATGDQQSRNIDRDMVRRCNDARQRLNYLVKQDVASGEGLQRVVRSEQKQLQADLQKQIVDYCV